MMTRTSETSCLYSEDNRIIEAVELVNNIEEFRLEIDELNFWRSASRLWLKPQLSDYQRVSQNYGTTSY
jgi:hypothetical protein